MADETFRLNVLLKAGEVHVYGNRTALRDLAEVCAALAELSEDDARTAANHVIYADYMNSADEGSVPMTVYLKLENEG